LSINALAVKIQLNKVVRWCQNGDFLHPVFSVSCMKHISDMRSKFALRPHHVWKYGRHPVSGCWDKARKKDRKIEITGQNFMATLFHRAAIKMKLSTLKWAQWDKTQSTEMLCLFICVCIALCTIAAHNIAQNRPDNFPCYPPDNHHCSDDVYLREGGIFSWNKVNHTWNDVWLLHSIAQTKSKILNYAHLC